MFVFMVVIAAIRIASLSYLFTVAPDHLPQAICISGGLVGGIGLLLTAWQILRPVSLRMLSWFYLLVIASVTFNLMYIKFPSRNALNWTDLGVIGALFELAAGIFLCALAAHELRFENSY